jgi:hypothetical protein
MDRYKKIIVLKLCELSSLPLSFAKNRMRILIVICALCFFAPSFVSAQKRPRELWKGMNSDEVLAKGEKQRKTGQILMAIGGGVVLATPLVFKESRDLPTAIPLVLAGTASFITGTVFWFSGNSKIKRANAMSFIQKIDHPSLGLQTLVHVGISIPLQPARIR